MSKSVSLLQVLARRFEPSPVVWYQTPGESIEVPQEDPAGFVSTKAPTVLWLDKVVLTDTVVASGQRSLSGVLMVLAKGMRVSLVKKFEYESSKGTMNSHKNNLGMTCRLSDRAEHVHGGTVSSRTVHYRVELTRLDNILYHVLYQQSLV